MAGVGDATLRDCCNCLGAHAPTDNCSNVKGYEIKTVVKSKSNSLKNLISKAFNDGQISEQEFRIVPDELDRYNDLKEIICFD